MLKVLFFAADPLSASPDGRSPRLLLDEDVRQIRQKVRAAEHRDALDFDVHLATRPDDLMQALNVTRPHVVHFSGHGNRHGLVLSSADGLRAHPVGAAALAQLFEVFRGDIRLVVLNACLSLPQAEAVANVVGCAIGTRGAISDEAAITFGAAFYRALAFGHSVRAAYDQARVALALEHPADSECPELVARPDVDPSRLVLVPAGGVDAGAREAPAAGAPPRDDGIWNQHALGLLAARPRARPARAARWAGIAAVASGLTAGIVFVDGDRGAEGLSVKISPVETAFPSRACPGTASAAPSDRLSAARDLYEGGNFAAALPLFQRAARAGDAEAAGFLGEMYLNGQGTDPDSSLAVRWLEEAKKTRDPRGMNALGAAYEQGEIVDQSDRWAMHWYERAAEEKDYAPAMRNVAKMHVAASPAQALRWYRRAADAGCVDALVDMGLIHQQGLAGAPDPQEALRLYRAAAAKGAARGMFAIGMMYQDGVGVPRDYDEARSWYLQAAQAGSADAMNNLGVLYQNGWGVWRNRATAASWYRRAADAGSSVAAANLAAMDEE